MTEPTWVLPEVVLAVQQMLIAEHGGAAGIRDSALLDSALNRAPQKYAYEKESTVFQLAASYAYGLAKNHPFVDGNKRIALTVAGIFLELNGYSLNAPEPEAVIFMEKMAAGQLEEQVLADWLEASSSSIR